MALTSADLARLGPAAQKQVLDKLAGAQKPKKSKYGNRKVARDGIKFDSEREAARFTELKVLRAMGKIRDLRLQTNFTLSTRSQGTRYSIHTSAAEAAASLHWSLGSILWGTKLTSTTSRCRKNALRNTSHKGVCFCGRRRHAESPSGKDPV